MSPNDLVLYLKQINVLPTKPFWWQPFGRTAVCVDVDGQRSVYQLNIADHVVKVYQASSQNENSGDFHFKDSIQLTDQQLVALPKQPTSIG
ncbi:hypothetical protein [Lactiplantibacillus daowaiensis]|uniref:Uncharacterized protein n=1 Tax=Lactiplantibacillus daowaiensis TaxID=2559918 RepID=A0ABW1S1E3_9LACO|nr:hypothetical protein [Lactiplantibacillus daowaiensis]